MPTFKTRVIPELAEGTRAILAPPSTPIIDGRGSGDINYECGSCGMILVDSVAPNIRIVGLVLKCPICGAFSEMAPPVGP